MNNGPEKEKINIDELVDFLVKRKESAPAPEQFPAPEQASAPAPEQSPAPEPVLPPEPALILPMDEDEPDEIVEPADAPAPEEIILPQPAPTVVQQAPPPLRAKKHKWFGLFGRRAAEDEEDEQSWLDWGLKPLGQYHSADRPESLVPEQATPAGEDTVQEDTAGEMDEFPRVQSVAETITMQVVMPSGVAMPRDEAHTRVIPLDGAAPAEPATPPQPQQEQLPDQLSLEEMVRVEEIQPEDEAPMIEVPDDPEEYLQRAREEKVREFTLGGEEEETNEPEDEYEQAPAEDPVPTEYTAYEDTGAVAEELQYRCRGALLNFLFSGLLELVLLFLTVLSVLAGEPPIPPMGYLTVHLFGLLLMMGLNRRAVARGLSGLFMLRANSDTAPAIASTVTLMSVLLHFANTAAPLPYWTPLAGLLLVFCAAGHYIQAASVRRNFAFVAYRGDKYAATLMEEENAVKEIGRRAAGSGEATVGYFRRTQFLSDYLTNADAPHSGDDWSRWLTPLGLGLSVLVSVMALVSGGVATFFEWLTLFVGLLCVTMPATHLAVQLPLNRCERVMLSRGGFLVGWKAVRQFGQLDALAVDMEDLYPDESMLLHGIKTFSGTHIDEAILAAASLAVRAGGPLSMIFRRIIENKEELLPAVDSLVYEQGMGLSGWVDGRRVFVGNRRLLQNHGVDVPSSDYEARYAKDGRRLVYLSVAGQLSAMVVVSYLPDPEIQDALQYLCRSRVTLLVRSCDPNITTQDLCESFGLEEYYVDVLPAAAGRAYVQLTEQESEQMPAVMASNGHILGTAWALSVCRTLRVKSLVALVIQTLSAGLGLVLCLSWAMLHTLSLFQPLLLVLATALLTWLVPLFKRL